MPIFNDSRDQALQAEARNRAHALQCQHAGDSVGDAPARLGDGGLSNLQRLGRPLSAAIDLAARVSQLETLLRECRAFVSEAHECQADSAFCAALIAKIDAALPPR